MDAGVSRLAGQPPNNSRDTGGDTVSLIKKYLWEFAHGNYRPRI
jgi:hypothetical protein